MQDKPNPQKTVAHTSITDPVHTNRSNLIGQREKNQRRKEGKHTSEKEQPPRRRRAAMAAPPKPARTAAAQAMKRKNRSPTQKILLPTKRTEKEERRRRKTAPRSKQSETDPRKPLLPYTSRTSAHRSWNAMTHANARDGTRDNDVQREQRCARPWELSAL
jgi:hypothetical protein